MFCCVKGGLKDVPHEIDLQSLSMIRWQVPVIYTVCDSVFYHKGAKQWGTTTYTKPLFGFFSFWQMCETKQNRKSSSCIYCWPVLALFFSSSTPDVDLSSLENRNSQPDVKRLQTDRNIREDFLSLLLGECSESRMSRGWKCRKVRRKMTTVFLLSDKAVVISWVSALTCSQWLMVWQLKCLLMVCLMSDR